MKQLSSFTIFTSGYAKVVSMTFPIRSLISANGLRTFNSEPSEFPLAMLNNILGLCISSAQTYKPRKYSTLRSKQNITLTLTLTISMETNRTYFRSKLPIVKLTNRLVS
ncbi:MAG: hypothetical protein ACTS44_01005 [Candidatus Hodgkinia cicadicola]